MAFPWTQERFRDEVTAAAALALGVRSAGFLELLQESHPAYADCSAAEVARRRGWVLLALGLQPLEDDALPVVLEELQSGHQPYLLAAAAQTLRSAVEPRPAFAGCLLRALETLARRDDFVSLEVWGGVPASAIPGSACAEVLRSIRWMGPSATGIGPELAQLVGESGLLADDNRELLEQILAALRSPRDEDIEDCCSLPLSWRRRERVVGTVVPTSVRFEDQDGNCHGWNDLFVGRPSVVVFFYTRCDNEQKCSLTIAKLGRLQKLIKEEGRGSEVNLVAITYDPEFDLPHRLRGYGESRGVVPGEHCRLLRTTQGRQALQDYFELGVNFTGTLVNRHRIEVYLLDSDGRMRVTYQRLGWDPLELWDEMQRIEKPASTQDRATAAAGAVPGLWAVLLALLPKCPICGATYLSSTGLLALPYLPGWERFWPVILTMLIVSLAGMAWVARIRRTWLPLVWGCAGVAVIIGPGLIWGQQAGLVVGAALIALGSVLAVAAVRFQRKVGSAGLVGAHAQGRA